MTTGHDEAHAWLAFAQGRNEDAIRLLRSVSGKQNVEGKGEVELHAREMLADMLREMDRRQDALAEYEKSFAVDPNRFNGLYGAAVAAQTLHQPQKTRAYISGSSQTATKAGIPTGRSGPQPKPSSPATPPA